MKRKIITLLLVLVMVLGLAANVSAEENYTSGDWSYTLYDGKATLKYYNGSAAEVVVPATIDGYEVDALGWGLTCPFSGVRDTLTSVVVSEGVRLIERQCFKDCTKLRSVTLPSTITHISTYAFQNCTGPTEIELNEGPEGVSNYAFLSTGLTSVYIPATVTSIGEDAFGYNGEMSGTETVDGFVIFGYAGTAAEKYASRNYHITFYDLTGATENSGNCGEGAAWRFEESTGTLYIEADPDADEAYTADYSNGFQPWILHAEKITRLVVGDGIRRLGNATMGFHYPNLREVRLPESLGEIGSNAFYGCTGLKQIDLPENLHYIMFQTFAHCGLTSIELPDELNYLGDSAFQECLDLTYAKLPSTLRDLGSRAFAGCVKLSTVDMPECAIDNPGEGVFLNCDSLTDISFYTDNQFSWYIFQDCDGLTNITLPEGTWEIGNGAFSYCDNLTHVTIPDGVYSMGTNVFNNCSKLSTVLFLGDAPNFDEFTFRGVTATCYYPAGNDTWTYYSQLQLGGNITWVAYDPDLFVDVPVDSFYYEPVVWAVENGVTTGADAAHFNPNGQCLRAQVVTFLWRAENCPEPETTVNPFVDVKESDFYYKAVLWAVENGITNGADAAHFNPMGICNRAQVVTFLHRAKGSPAPESLDLPFTDVPADDWYTAPVAWAVENGVTNGISATEFGPNAACNRAQVVTFLCRAAMIPAPAPDSVYRFALTSNDTDNEIGFIYPYGLEYKAGESVLFYAEPWYGYVVEFTSDPVVEGLQLRYLGAYIYELTMPAHDLTIHANFIPASGSHHTITTTCRGGEFITNADYNDDYQDIAKPGEHVLIYIYPDEGFTLTEENVSATAGGAAVENFWFLGEFVDEYPEENLSIRYFLCELVMPDADVNITINCTEGASASAAQTRMNVDFK